MSGGVDQGIQDDIGHVRKNGDAQDEPRESESEGHPLGSHQADHGTGNDLDPAGVAERLGDDGPQDDDDPDGPQGFSEPEFEGIDEVVPLNARKDPEEQDRCEEG